MNKKQETIQSKTEDFKSLVSKTQKDIADKNKIIQNYSNIIAATKREY